MRTGDLSPIVWPIVVLTSVAIAAVTVVLLFASAQAAAMTALCSAVILPVLTQLLSLAKQERNHVETKSAIQETKETLASRIANET